MQLSTTMMKIVTFLSYLVFGKLHYFIRNHKRNLEILESSL